MTTPTHSLLDDITTGLVLKFPEDDADAREYVYHHADSGRRFTVHTHEDAEGALRCVMTEQVPNGRMFKGNPHLGSTPFWEEPTIRQAEEAVGPNRLLAELDAIGLKIENMVFEETPSGGRNGIFYPTIDACVQSILARIENDHRHVGLRQLADEEMASYAIKDEKQSLAYWQAQQAIQEEADTDSGLFKGCHSLISTSLDDVLKKGILGYLNAPSQSGWEQIRSHHITTTDTLWKAWVLFDSSAPRLGSNQRHPSPDILRNAIRQTIVRHHELIEEKLESLKTTTLRLCR